MVINAAGFTLDLDEPTLEEIRNEKPIKSLEKSVEVGQVDIHIDLGVDTTDDSITDEQYQAFLTDPRRI